jgi:hypothetical protein
MAFLLKSSWSGLSSGSEQPDPEPAPGQLDHSPSTLYSWVSSESAHFTSQVCTTSEGSLNGTSVLAIGCSILTVPGASTRSTTIL